MEKPSAAPGNTCLILLPGLDGTGRLFGPLLEILPDALDVKVIDFPMERHIPFTDLPDFVIPRLPHDRGLVLLGESYSGPLALKLAAHADLDVRGVILTATFARYPSTLMARVSRFLPLTLLLRLPVPGFLIKRYCFGADDTARLRALLREVLRMNRPGVLARRARQGASLDVRPEARALRLPCLYIEATDDRLVPAKARQDLQLCMPRMRLQRIDGAHFILQARPRECRRAILSFMRELETAGSESAKQAIPSETKTPPAT